MTEQLNNNTWVKNRAGVPQVAQEAGRGPAQWTDIEPAVLFLQTLNPHAPPKGLLSRFGRSYMVCHPRAPRVEDQTSCTPEHFFLPLIWHHQELHTGSWEEGRDTADPAEEGTLPVSGWKRALPKHPHPDRRVLQPFSHQKPLVWIEEEPKPKI